MQKIQGRSTMIIRRASEADFIFTADEYDGELRVLKFNGNEGISKPFRYAIKLAALDSEIDFNTIVGKSACLSISHETGERYVNGIVTRFTQFGKSGTGRRYTIYHAEFVPLIWLLKYRHGCRIFQNMTFEGIIRQVFQDAGVGNNYYRFTLTGTHNSHEYCVQYRESDFNFISRLMEEEGIFYYFDHTEDMHVMVIADNSSAHSEIESSTIVFNESTSMVYDQEYVYEFKFLQQVKPSSASLRDFNYERPSLGMDTMALSGDENLLPEEENLEIYDYPGNYQDPDFGAEIVSIKLDSLKTNRQMGIGKSICRRFLPGYRFTLDRHYRSSFNQEYLITHLVNSGTQPLGENSDEEGFQYNNNFECIAYSVPFRPPRKTPKPVIDGAQTAYVVGPSGDDIYFDELGRVKVQFHWDRVGRNDENSSCWVRVSDGYAGQNHGIQFTPLIGDEVIVDFLEGDPDRPIIVGRVYNAANMPPLKPQDRIQNVILTPYQHRLLMDDKGAHITLNTGGKETVKMSDGKKDTDFGNNINISTADAHFIQLADGSKAQGITISTLKGNMVVLDDKNENITVITTNGHIAVLDDKNKKIEIKSTDSHSITIDDQGQSITVVDSSDQHKFQIDISGQKLIISTDSGSIDMLAPSGTVTIKASQVDIDASQGIEAKAGTDVKINGGTNVNIEAGMEMTSKGLNVTSEAGLQHSIKGTMVSAEASGIHTIKGGLVEIN